MKEMGKKKRIGFIALLVLASLAIGMFSGVGFYKQLIKSNAAGFWIKGATALKDGHDDYALLYFTQAVTLKNDEPMFFRSVAEVYEKQQKTEMAIEFYKLALNLYKREKTNPTKSIVQKIESLEKELENKQGGR